MQTISRSDGAFSDTFRADIWHHDLFVASHHLMHFVAFPGNPHACSINVMDLASREVLHIDRLDPAKMEYQHQPDHTPASCVMDFDKVMTQEKLPYLLVTSYRTMHTLRAQHAGLFECRPKDPNNASRIIENIKGFLHAPCTKPHIDSVRHKNEGKHQKRCARAGKSNNTGKASPRRKSRAVARSASRKGKGKRKATSSDNHSSSSSSSSSAQSRDASNEPATPAAPVPKRRRSKSLSGNESDVGMGAAAQEKVK